MMRKLRFCLCVFTLVLACVLLASCGSDDGAPKGFYLASEPETDGFYLYVPDEWSKQRASGVVTAYLSDLSTANISASYVTTDKTDMGAYWAASEEELRRDFTDYTLDETCPEETVVADRPAYLYRYDGTYAGVKYGFHQYFILVGDDPSAGMYVITYTASKDRNARTGTVDYDKTVANAAAIAKNFKIYSEQPGARQDLADTTAPAPEGMKKANRFDRFGLDFYVPDTWRVDLSDGFIGAVAGDGASVGLNKISYESAVKKLDHYGTGVSESGFTQSDYWKLLQAEYRDYFDDETFEVTAEPDWEDEEGKAGAVTPEGGECSYRSFTFEGKRDGKTYRVTLYLLWETGKGRNMYLLTYTATPETHDAHIGEVERMLREMRF